MKQRLYISGHSLTNPRVAGFLYDMATAAGIDLAWDQQYLGGSSIRQRREGNERGGKDASYRHGVDRWGRPADVLAAFATRRQDERPIDTLVVTEQHAVLGSLAWQGTIGSLRHIHDSFIRANPTGRSVFFEPWLSVDDKTAPGRWIAYERAAAPVWNCVVASVNRSLANEGRADRLVSMPLGLALANLIERVAGPSAPTPLNGRSLSDRMNMFFEDDVHLTPAGDHYIAAVMFRYLYGNDAAVVPKSADFDEQLARFTAGVADQFVAEHPLSRPGMSAEECRDYVATKFVDTFLDYYYDVDWKKNMGFAKAVYTKWKTRRDWSQLYSKDNRAHPFADHIRQGPKRD